MICDNLSLFYFRYIFKYLSQLKIMDSDVFYDKYISCDFEEKYVPHDVVSLDENGYIFYEVGHIEPEQLYK